jgi:two-component system phosphate regulon sensor histidine kinase PhoR
MPAAKDMVSDAQRAPDFARTGSASQHYTWTATAQPKGPSEFESVLLAIAGHDLRQPLQIIQSAHELLGMSMRTSSELRCLRSGQNAIDRLTKQLTQLTTALRFREHSATLTLAPIRVERVLRQAYYENEDAALRKGISLRMVSTDAMIRSDTLLLGAALRNLVSNAVNYTTPGGRVLVGCRYHGSILRIDVYDNGPGVPSSQMPSIFEAFTRLDTGQREGLGIGLFIVRQALALLGHGIEVCSHPSSGSRFSILTPRLGSYS